MSRYLDAFETLAQRGSTVGEAKLFDRVEAELAGSVGVRSSSEKPRRRISGPLIALASFFVVLLVQAAFLVFGIGGSGDTAEVEHGFRFGELGRDLLQAQADRGGFVAFDGSTGTVVFSLNGVEWLPTDIADFVGMPRDLVATKERWLLAGSSSDAMWTSTDGTRWDRIDVPAALAEVYRTMVADSHTVLAQVQDPFLEQSPTLWRLDEKLEWRRVTPIGLPDDDKLFIAGRPDGKGFVAIATSSGGFTTWTSADGSTWTGGTPVTITTDSNEGRIGTFAVAGADGWVALSIGHGTEGQTLFVHRSDDGRQWDELPAPPFTEPLLGFWSVDQAMLVATEGAVWLTRDGATWNMVHSFAAPAIVWDATLVGDQVVVLWQASESNSTPDTTMILPPAEPDPAGTALQDEILADGVVTREEFESAVAAMVQCMEERGVEVLEWTIESDGSYGFTTSGDLGGVDYFCSYSYIDRIAAELAR